jgi:hypothetical protein
MLKVKGMDITMAMDTVTVTAMIMALLLLMEATTLMKHQQLKKQGYLVNYSKNGKSNQDLQSSF